MASFSTKDFFGDPLWPAEFHMTKKRPQQKEIENDFSYKEQQQDLIKIEEIEPEGAYELSPEDMLDLEKNFLLNQEKLDSMMKHSEITFMDENFSQNKDLASIFTSRKSAFITGKRKQNIDHEDSIYFDQKLSILQPGLDQCPSKKGKRKLKKKSKILKKRKKQEIGRKEKRLIRRYKKSDLVISKLEDYENGMFTRSGKKIGGEQKQIGQAGQKQNQQIALVKYSVKNQESSKEKAQEAKIIELPQQIPQLQMQIMRKFELLPPVPQIQHPEINLQHQSQCQMNSPLKFNKYKILTKQEKEYLVYLASQTTTCQVARRFNISVNNICRWKKGCERKMGAGRKITSMELESKVIDYVKEAIESGKTLSRKEVQMKARQFSNNSDFKASKGWFQRFYNRNFKIFVKVEPRIQQIPRQNSE